MKFKFGRGFIEPPYRWFQTGVTQNNGFASSGMTMNFVMSVDPAQPFIPRQNVADRYAHKIVNPNLYSEIKILPKGSPVI